jgi:hypothetical protein
LIFLQADMGDDKPQWPSFPPSEEMWSVPEDCRWDEDDGKGAMNADDGDGTVTYMPGDEIAPEHEKEVSPDPWFGVWGLGFGVWGLGFTRVPGNDCA